ncbi:class I SAM-dependent methyltransferase [Chitinophaga rhizophila]|uniref:Class I SAM-dependent methyltransferase n=1 Tax=Chitinophaga rhizophila TaxID=2866212 RepID=A0ABS7G775_9BACT|nr:class I SAM-dependent methyltransferase [Chitinophaga rhizophila]MBW8683145.1 class I SAM-dependent methyltransferase [Chitinophaga rhizophila]
MLIQPSTWDKQYTQGAWEVLKSPLEEKRFESVRNFIYKYAPGGDILEVGCGEGLLQRGMDRQLYNLFTGIDVSNVAILRTEDLWNAQNRYMSADMETWQPDSQRFDIIIFNESLYYASYPLELMTRYFSFLKPGGAIILSVYETPPNQQLLDAVEKLHPATEATITENERGRWHCRIYRYDK